MKRIVESLRPLQCLKRCRSPFQSSAHAASKTGMLIPEDNMTLFDFMSSPLNGGVKEKEVLSHQTYESNDRRYFIETYGCQMNVNDSDIVHTVLQDKGFRMADSAEEADVVLLNTCAIRENAEAKIWQRLGYFKNLKVERRAKVGHYGRGPIVSVLGCMAERLKQKLLDADKLVDIVAGPDAYRDLPRLIEIVSPLESKVKRDLPTAMNVQLSLEETYADIIPVRNADSKSVFLSIMRGCNNMCSFCVVPYTRGRERSRPLSSILDEVKYLRDTGTKEITLLGQNVNSYADFQEEKPSLDDSKDYFKDEYARGFVSVYKPNREGSRRFADLLHDVASIDPEIRFRFTSPHPKDFSNDVIDAIKSHDNICKQLHMPAQSGSSSVLARMKRGYTRESYDELVATIRSQIPGVALSTDMITGFCGESDLEHSESVDLMQTTKFDLAFLFAYSIRDKTHAARHYEDDVPQNIKIKRLQDLIFEYRKGLQELALEEVGRRHIVLVEGVSKRCDKQLTGRTDSFKRVVFDNIKVSESYKNDNDQFMKNQVSLKPGDYAAVEIISGGKGATLHARALARTTIGEFVAFHQSTIPLTKYS